MVSVRLCEGQSSDRRERPALTFCPWWCLVYDVISKSWLFIHFSLFYLVLLLYNTTHKFGVGKKVILVFNKDTLNWSKGSKDIYNFTKYLYKKWMLFFLNFLFIKQKIQLYQKNITQHNSIKSAYLEWFLKENSALHQEYFTILQLLLVCYFLINAVSIRYFQNIKKKRTDL